MDGRANRLDPVVRKLPGVRVAADAGPLAGGAGFDALVRQARAFAEADRRGRVEGEEQLLAAGVARQAALAHELEAAGLGAAPAEAALRPVAYQALAHVAFELGLADAGVARALGMSAGRRDVPTTHGARLASASGAAGTLRALVHVVLAGLRERAGEPGGEAWDADAGASARLADVWAGAEASRALAFAAARALDRRAALEDEKVGALAGRGVARGHAETALLDELEDDAMELAALAGAPPHSRDQARFDALAADPLLWFLLADGAAAVLSPACRLWSALGGAVALRDAVGLVGASARRQGERGAVLSAWLEAARDATGGEPDESVRRELADAMTEGVFLAQFRSWIAEMRGVAALRPGTGACTVATAMELWLRALAHAVRGGDERGGEGAPDERFFDASVLQLADALCWLLAARAQVLDVVAFDEDRRGRAPGDGDLTDAARFFTWLSHAATARAAGEVGRMAAEVVCGGVSHPSWDTEGCAACYQADDLEELDELFPGFAGSAPAYTDVIEADGSHRPKAGPCVRFAGLDAFLRLRAKLDGCLSGSWHARRQAAQALATAALE